MARLSMTDVARQAKAAGFPSREIARATAVAYAESSGDTNAHHVTSREDSRGLWQINVKAWPQLASGNLYDPATNARAALTVRQQQGWTAWSVYTLGAYALYMPQAEVAAQRVDPRGGILAAPAQAGTHLPDTSAGVASGITDATKAAGQLVQVASKTGAWISTPANWLRIVYVLVGGGLVVGGLLILSRPVLEPAVKTGVKIATKGIA